MSKQIIVNKLIDEIENLSALILNSLVIFSLKTIQEKHFYIMEQIEKEDRLDIL